MDLLPLGTAEAAVFETIVVPRYLAPFGAMALEAFSPGPSAQVLHLGCRTGYPDLELGERLQGGSLLGVDPSPAAVEIARAKAHVLKGVYCEYSVSSSLPTSFADENFTDLLCLHPPSARPEQRASLLAEASRLLMTGGQMILALPLRGSFQEITDLLREHALKHDADEVGRAAEAAAMMRPNIEALSEEVEAAGFEDIDVSIHRGSYPLAKARELLEDPAMRLLVLPEIRAGLGLGELVAPLSYVRDAVEKYFADGAFDLTVNVGCVRAIKA